MEDLSKLLAVVGQEIPKTIVFQFDNCGENKVGYYDYYRYGFLIVFLIDFGVLQQ